MKKLKLKQEFEGMIITRKHFVVGEITFNANQVPEDKYQNYSKSGFEDLFEEVTEEIKEIKLVGDGEITGITFTDKPIVPFVKFDEPKPANKTRKPRQKK